MNSIPAGDDLPEMRHSLARPAANECGSVFRVYLLPMSHFDTDTLNTNANTNNNDETLKL